MNRLIALTERTTNLIKFAQEDEEEGSTIGATAGALAGGAALAGLPGAIRKERALATATNRVLRPGTRINKGYGATLTRGISRMGWKGKAALGIAGAIGGGWLGSHLGLQSRIEQINFGLRDDINIFKQLNLKPAGFQPGYKNIPGAHMVNDMQTKSTLALRKGDKVKDLFAKVAASREKFGSMARQFSIREDLQRIIQLAPLTQDPRPRNDLGMFKNEPDMGPNPNTIHVTYKESPAMGAAKLGKAARNEGALAKIASKLRGMKV